MPPLTHSARRSHLLQGVEVPPFFYGTAWKEERTRALTRQALDLGLLAIDTANQRKHYFEAGVGEATASLLGEGRVQREQLFLQTKFTFARGQDERMPYDAGAPYAAQVEQSFRSSLEHLATSYVDAYLLHGPSVAGKLAAADWEVWQAMESLQRSGQARLLGVSNVSLAQLSELFDRARIKPALVQNRCLARTGWDREVRAFCRAHGLGYEGFALLTGNRRELEHPALGAIAERLRRTPQQVVFRFALQAGMIPVTGSSSPAHLADDLACFGFELSEPDMAKLETLASAC